MSKYVIRRILQLIPVLLCISFIIFFLVDLIPGDVVDQIAPAEATEEQKEAMREEMGLNRNVFVRYLEYMKNLFHGDMGRSLVWNKPVFEVYISKLPHTLFLGFVSVLVSIMISIPLGIYAAMHRGTIQDNVSMVGAILGLSIPNFWLGLLLILLFSLKIALFPSGGIEKPFWWVLPAITIGTGLAASLTRTTRSSMLEVINQDYLRTARSKGAPEKTVIRKHAFKNALIPIITVIGNQFNATIAGAMLTETVFSIPGVGRLVVEATNMRDVPLLTGTILLDNCIVCIVLLIVDLVYAVVDPRIKGQFASKAKKRG